MQNCSMVWCGNGRDHVCVGGVSCVDLRMMSFVYTCKECVCVILWFFFFGDSCFSSSASNKQQILSFCLSNNCLWRKLCAILIIASTLACFLSPRTRHWLGTAMAIKRIAPNKATSNGSTKRLLCNGFTKRHMCSMWTIVHEDLCIR